MDPIELFRFWTDPERLAVAFGVFSYLVLFAIVFAESGLFFGFFLPGDSLLFTAGVVSSQQGPTGEPLLILPLLIVVVVVAAVTGDAVGYTFGRRVGRRLYDRPNSRWFRRSHLLAAEAFYEKHGGKTIVLARFLPFVRTFAPIVAGTANMPYRRFAIFNITGGLLWAVSLTTAGYLLGEALGDTIDRVLVLIIVAIVAISILPTAVHLFMSNRSEISSRFGRTQ
ncbi:MAG: VTT domain-containing protein [Candidatus Limnocylindrales bacterium]